MFKRRSIPILMIGLAIPLACLFFLADAPAGSTKDLSVDGEAAAASNPTARVCSLDVATCRIPSLRPELAPTYPADCSGAGAFRQCVGVSFTADEYIPRTCWVKVNAKWNLPHDAIPSIAPVPGVLICP
jgi:hypothetical protein